MTSIGNRQALLFGGLGKYNEILNDTWLFDLGTKTWVELKPKNPPPVRFNHKLCQISENIAILFGGETQGLPFYDDTWLFNLTDTSWTKLELGIHPESRTNFGMSQISSNCVLLFGGRNNDKDNINDTWLFDINKKLWECVDSVPDWWNYDRRPFERDDPILAQVGENKLILFGGYYYGHYFSDTWLFDLDSLKWKKLNTKGWIDSTQGGAGVNLFRTKILSYGGETTNWNVKSLMFDLYDTTWYNLDLNESPGARRAFGMAKVDEAKVLLFGGTSDSINRDDTWLFTADINGVDDVNNISDDFHISPNPAEEFIEISVGSRHALTNKEFHIFNVLGEIVSISVCSADTSAGGGQRIDVSGLPSGVYFVRVGDKVMKFVKK